MCANRCFLLSDLSPLPRPLKPEAEDRASCPAVADDGPAVDDAVDVASSSLLSEVLDDHLEEPAWERRGDGAELLGPGVEEDADEEASACAVIRRTRLDRLLLATNMAPC